MKNLFVPLLFFILMFPATRAQEVYSVEACFDSYVQGSYCFVDMEGTTFNFQDMEPSAMEKYDLTDGNYLGRMFMVVYRIETTVYEKEEREEEQKQEEYEDDENGEEQDDIDGSEYQEYSIVDLELIG